MANPIRLSGGLREPLLHDQIYQRQPLQFQSGKIEMLAGVFDFDAQNTPICIIVHHDSWRNFLRFVAFPFVQLNV